MNSNEIPGQLSLFGEPEPSAARYVALSCRPYWTTSWDRIRSVQDEGIDTITRVVKDEFCPYGYAGHYGSGGKYIGYNMQRGGIRVLLAPKNAGGYSGGEIKVTWEEFAREIIDKLWRGEEDD